MSIGGYDFHNSASAIVISNGVLPKANEVANINHIVLERGLGQGAVFIHRLTVTDLSRTGLVCVCLLNLSFYFL